MIVFPPCSEIKPLSILDFRRRIELALGAMFRRELQQADATRFYVVLASEIEMPPGLTGFTLPGGSLVYRDAIADRWSGHGPLMVLNDQMPEANGERWHLWLASIVAHEAAHRIDSEELFWNEWKHNGITPAEAAELIGSGHARIIPSGAPAWAGHDSRFIRAAMHIGYRLSQMGWPIVPDVVFSAGDYGIEVDGSEWFRVLKRDCVLRRRSSLTAVMQSAPPAVFSTQWEAVIGGEVTKVCA